MGKRHAKFFFSIMFRKFPYSDRIQKHPERSNTPLRVLTPKFLFFAIGMPNLIDKCFIYIFVMCLNILRGLLTQKCVLGILCR